MRRFTWITAIAAPLALLGCAEERTSQPTTNTARPRSNPSNDVDGRTTVAKPVLGDGAAEATRPDNTAVNTRDREADAVVPTDQGNNQADLEKTADIRKRILQNKEMSIKGQNVKVVTLDGKVTLRGPVASDAEKKIIEDIARSVAGIDRVASELEVAPE